MHSQDNFNFDVFYIQTTKFLNNVTSEIAHKKSKKNMTSFKI